VTGPVGFIEEMDGPIIVDTAEPASSVPPEDQIVSGTVCNSQEVSFEKVIPTVMLVMDRSTSMFASNIPNGSSPTPWGSYNDRWEALRAAVALLEPYAADIQLSGTTYTGFMNEADGECPVLQGVDVAPALNNFAQVQSLLPASAEAFPLTATGNHAGTETPTAEGLEAAVTALSAVEAEGPKYIVLITDGLPDVCTGRPELVNKGPWCAHDPAYGVVQEAFAAGIKTFVIGIGNFESADEQAASDHFLNGLAHAGQGLELAPNPPQDANSTQPRDLHCIQQESRIARGVEPANDFYENWRDYAAATYGADGLTYTEKLYLEPDDSTLGPQLAEVIQGVRSCSFEMDDAVVRAQASKGAVRLEFSDGTFQDLVYEDADGWTLDPENDYTVVVQGQACTDVQTLSELGIKIQFPCEVRVPRVR
jgi:hypothetical protein